MRTLANPIRATEAPAGIDLAPMLDFVVNLLVFFIVTAVFVKQAGVEVNRPTKTSSEGGNASKVIVIDERGELSIDTKPVDLRAVRAHIEQYRATADGGVLIVADEHAPTGAVVAVVDEVHLGGLSDITFTIQAAVP